MASEASAAVTHRDLANAIRFLGIDAVEKAKSGHPGMVMGMADLATVLFTKHLRFDPSAPHWPDRDRFVLSNGHGSMLLYALLHLTGYEQATLEELKRFRQFGARTAGHPEYGHLEGVETTTGPLGQGLATAVGMALAERKLAAEFGADLVDHHTWVFVGDGCLMEGISQEAISFAGHLGLSKLIVVHDNNHITIDGSTSLSTGDDVRARFAASGWETLEVDGHDAEAIDAAFTLARKLGAQLGKPVFISARTHIGFGSPGKQDSEGAHGAPLGAAEIEKTRAALGWPYAPFEVPEAIRAVWLKAGARGAAGRAAWQARLEGADAAARAEFTRRIEGRLPADLQGKVEEGLRAIVASPADIATRAASQRALELLTAAVPELLGGSADLTHSVLTRTKGQSALTPENFTGSHINYGVREFGMAAIMNGLALHGGYLPYGGTFLVFSDYARPAIRLGALMGTHVTYVLTHDSIGLGEDGPTHQPVEHLAALRAIPGLKVYRPADPVEALECWYDAVSGKGPSALVASRQAVPQVRRDPATAVQPFRGAYVLKEAEGGRDITLLATGTEVSLAVSVAEALAGEGIRAAVVSMPSWERFEEQDAAYKAAVLGNAPRLAIEAAEPFGWTRYVAREDDVCGVRGFGLSAPAGELYRHFGLTVEAIVPKARALAGR
ncbi:transketolase [Pseudoxanthobacter sp.]|uniref:transketolase n=1 Tax=Pseudoxanthobacter sp. TaxID=1925742 RepID=UPI002FE28211